MLVCSSLALSISFTHTHDTHYIYAHTHTHTGGKSLHYSTQNIIKHLLDNNPLLFTNICLLSNIMILTFKILKYSKPLGSSSQIIYQRERESTIDRGLGYTQTIQLFPILIHHHHRPLYPSFFSFLTQFGKRKMP